MATEFSVYDFTAIAGADYSTTGKYRFVRFSANRTVVTCSAVTDIPCGVLQNNPISGGAAQVRALGLSKIESDEALTAGWLVGPSADGQADRKIPGTDTTNYIGGQVVESTGAVGELGSILVDCMTPHRAA